jgi:hypothetical protein
VRCEQRKGGGCGAGPTIWRGKWRAFKNGGWEGKFGGVWKIEVHIEALMELFFFSSSLQILEWRAIWSPPLELL